METGKIMDGVCVQPPWVTYGEMVKKLFERDPDIVVSDVEPNNNGYALHIKVYKHEKYKALTKIIPQCITFGNVALTVLVYDVENNTTLETTTEDIVHAFETVFADNPILDYTDLAEDMTGTQHGFVVFKPEVLQFYNDQLFSINGIWSGLAEDLAREVFIPANNVGIHFCTGVLNETETEPEENNE